MRHLLLLTLVFCTGVCFAAADDETYGNVTVEAMASGLPVLVSRQCGCAATLVEAGGNGWLFDGRRVEEIVSVLRECMRSAQLKRMGERSREIIAQWGLERFCQGVAQSLQFVSETPPQQFCSINRVLLRGWHGRYRQT